MDNNATTANNATTNEMTVKVSDVVKTNEMTVKIFSEKYKMDVVRSSQFLQGLCDLGIAKIVRQQRSENGKGKPSNVFAIPETATLTFK